MKLLYIEDEHLFGVMLQHLVKELGHECLLAETYTKGIDLFHSEKPDLLVVDVHLNSGKDGIDLVQELGTSLNVPFIYLTSEISDEAFERAKSTRPFGFLNKPISELNLRRNIELAIAESRRVIESDGAKDKFFVRDGSKFIKLNISETLFVEVQDKYCMIHTQNRVHTVRIGLKAIKENLTDDFIQIHRSYIINIHFLDSIQQTRREAKIGSRLIPIGRNYYEKLKARISYLDK